MEKVLLINSQNSESLNFNKTVIEGKSLIDLEPFLKTDDYNELKNRFGESKKVKIWGITSLDKNNVNFTRNINIMNKIKSGDFALFLNKASFHHRAVIVHKLIKKNQKLSSYLWNSDKYDLIFFMDEVTNFDIPRKLLFEAANINLGDQRFSIKELDNEKSNIIFKKFFNKSFINNTNEQNKKVNENLSMSILEKVKVEIFPEEENVDVSDETAVTSNLETESTISQDDLANKINDVIMIGEEDGSIAQSDGITKYDKLDRLKVINSFKSLYLNYAKTNVSPFFSGIFADWGKGKSSFVEMIKDEIEKESVDKVTHVVSKIDCSLIDQKEYLWLHILEQVINDTDQKKAEDKYLKGFLMRWRFKMFNIIKLEFNLNNLVKLICSNKFILFLYTLFFILGLYLVQSSKNEELAQFKNLAGWLTLTITAFKGISNLNNYIQGIFLSSMKSNKKLVYFKSQHEYKQLISILNKSLKSEKSLRILVILDEVDRMNKELFSDLIEITQLFKSIQIQDDNRKNKVTMDFLFSFNHKIVFPIIGKSVMLEDEHLLKDSVSDSMMNDEGDINKFKLGKEYMDKYLDLIIYLEDKPDLKNLIQSIFDPYFLNEQSTILKDNTIQSINIDNSTKTISSNQIKKAQIDNEDNISNENDVIDKKNNLDNEQIEVPVFSNKELEVIHSVATKYNSDPRKLIRLKNSLLLLRMLNRNESYKNIDEEKYLKELFTFVSSYLSDSDLKFENEEEIIYLRNSSYILGSNN